MYLFAVYAVVGLPSVIYIRVEPQINVVPFLDMIADYKNAILNIILFIPLGIMVTLICEHFSKVKNTFFLGFGMTLTIEILQIFTYRATDINDVITNTMGTMIGYYIAKMITRKYPSFMNIKVSKNGLFFLFALAFGIMFLIQPFISSMIWEIVL